ncbi:conserved hypothetical protein [gamma proteobacterium HTCC5015]|nr:conserved hypothetical protein [gamma proteobacterium HTCC5015]
MKLILSRKGFDSSAGGCPSPVFEDGSFITLPIPDEESPIQYGDIRHASTDVGRLVSDLTGNASMAIAGAHLDPDLMPEHLSRSSGWRPNLGQHGTAQSHLIKQSVQVGDLFLFFGLFQRAEWRGNGYQFLKQHAPFHALWGWLQIGCILPLEQADLVPQWARYHPHCFGQRHGNNSLYVASEKLFLNGRATDFNGAGVFNRLTAHHRLTRPESARRTEWQLPEFFYPDDNTQAMSYHANLSRWQRSEEEGLCALQAAARGQEFVFQHGHKKACSRWINNLLAKGG